jgi:hypothetical protein
LDMPSSFPQQPAAGLIRSKQPLPRHRSEHGKPDETR